jgi:antitoxin (DNA-binding transcriptional repressor) of toxin-antitoxin stability system
VHQVDVAEAAGQLKSLLKAALKGEKVVIVEDAGSVELVPVKRSRRRRQFGNARGVFKIPEDIDSPISDFDEYRS